MCISDGVARVEGYTSDNYPVRLTPRKNTAKENHQKRMKLKGQGKEVEEPTPYRTDPVARQKKQPPAKAALPPLPEQRHESEKDPTRGIGRCNFGRGPEKLLERPLRHQTALHQRHFFLLVQANFAVQDLTKNARR